MSAKDERWVWVDLEMTGLDPEKDCILQIATIITDGNFNERGRLDIVVWQPESALETMGPFVRKMHTDNGLLERVRSSKIDLAQAEQMTLELVASQTRYRKGILAGNSVWQDRRFLERYMPCLEGHLHYRQIDVSSLKVIFHSWFGQAGHAPKSVATHTALEDIKASIEELKFYRQFIKMPPAATKP